MALQALLAARPRPTGEQACDYLWAVSAPAVPSRGAGGGKGIGRIISRGPDHSITAKTTTYARHPRLYHQFPVAVIGQRRLALQESAALFGILCDITTGLTRI